MFSSFCVYDLPKWIEENKDTFRPPVCNKCLYNDQLTVFLVGGPNLRKDFHLEEGEEFFFQMKGDMCLKVVEEDTIKDIHIKEGQVFLLPSRVLHSPQRFENTVGLVVERRRAPWEYDSLRYHMEGTTQILFERWIHLKDIVQDLPPIIKEYFESEAHRTGQPILGSISPNPPYSPDPEAQTEHPLHLHKWLKHNENLFQKGKPIQLYGPPKYKTHVNIYGMGKYHLGARSGDTFLYQVNGNVNVISDDGQELMVNEKNTMRIPTGRSVMIQVNAGHTLTVYMDSPKKKETE